MKFIAHRGYSAHYPQNSLEAFQAVIDHPCNGSTLVGIELDTHLTADGRLPVMHEVSVPDESGRTTSVAECTFKELQHFFHLQHGDSRPSVPDLPAVFRLVNHATHLCIEIKDGPYNPERFIRALNNALSVYQPRNDITISSFSTDIIEHVKRYLRGHGLQYACIFKNLDALDAILSLQVDQIHPDYRCILKDPARFSSAVPLIRCWTVNEAGMVSLLKSTGVPIDAIMTDDIELARQFPDENI
jgi:glycerophosphoryl diester phosphodiesterase